MVIQRLDDRDRPGALQAPYLTAARAVTYRVCRNGLPQRRITVTQSTLAISMRALSTLSLADHWSIEPAPDFPARTA